MMRREDFRIGLDFMSAAGRWRSSRIGGRSCTTSATTISAAFLTNIAPPDPLRLDPPGIEIPLAASARASRSPPGSQSRLERSHARRCSEACSSSELFQRSRSRIRTISS
jgi:hypothetical protein